MDCREIKDKGFSRIKDKVQRIKVFQGQRIKFKGQRIFKDKG